MTRVMAVRRPVPRSPGSVGPQGPLHGRHRGVRISRSQPPAQGFTRNDLGPDHPAKDRRKRDLPHAAWPFDPSSGPVRQGPGTDQPDALKQEQRFTPINWRPASRLAKRLMPDRAARPRSSDIRRPTIGPFIEPATQQFIDAIANEPPVESLSPALARAALIQMQSAPVGRPGADIHDGVLPTGPTGSVPVRIVRPRGVTDPLPAVMYFHGGGWVRGGADTHDRLAREIAVGARVCVI